MAASVTPADFAIPKSRKPFRLRVIPPIDTYPSVIASAQTVLGKAVILSLFALGLSFYMTRWKAMTLWLVLMTLLPQRRRMLVTIGLLQWTFLMPLERTGFSGMVFAPLVQKAVACAIGGLLFWTAVRFKQSVLGTRPIVALLGGYAVTIYVVSTLVRVYPAFHAAWGLTVTFSFYLWFIGYALLDRNSSTRDPFRLQLGTFHPFWGSTHVPFPKGAAYLRRIEAHTPEKLAVTQLKGLKLLAWGLLLKQILRIGQAVIYGRLGLPTFAIAFDHVVHRTPDSSLVCWLSLIASFLEAMLVLCVTGNRFIACCRMAGFAALRNTYRPLEARTIAEFWNRYYYYFKELLVEFFFFPAFIRFFKEKPRLRLFFATLAAATFGNSYYHFFNDPEAVARLGFWHAIVAFQPYLLYSTVLGVGIGISQIREHKPIAPGWVRGRALPCLAVTSFYCLLHIFCDPSRTYPIREHFRFLAHLFNLPV
ncbi:MAG: hypothetical protein WA209_07265 [Candidatus Acidiferrales bacterium]